MSPAETTLQVLQFVRHAIGKQRWDPDANELLAKAKLLEDLPVPDLKRAAIHHLQTSQFPPTVAELRKLALPDTKPSGELAFDYARRAAHHASPYDGRSCSEAWAALELKDPVAAEACRAFGGFRAFWDLASDDVNTSRAQFRGIYNGLAQHARIASGAKTAELALAGGPQLPRGGDPRKLL